MEPLRTAVVGLKGIGQTHLKAIASIGEVELVAVCDVVEEIATSAGAEKGVPHYTSLETLLADQRVEAVSLGTPHHLHAPQAIQALSAGRHVITDIACAALRFRNCALVRFEVSITDTPPAAPIRGASSLLP